MGLNLLPVLTMITVMILFIIGFIVSIADTNNQEVNDVPEGIITDIFQVSAGGFGHSSKCILEIDGNKGNYRGSVCSFQIGDSICKRKYLLLKDVVKC